MTTITIELPSDLAAQAAMAGLLDAPHLERLVRAALRSKAKADLLEVWRTLDQQPIPPLTAAELDVGAKALSAH